MNNKLLKLARYLRQNGLYTEAAAVNAFKWEDNEPVGRATLSDVIPSTAPRSQKQKLIELLNAAEIVRKYKGNRCFN
jgi:hypothetical protein